ncbi:MAG: DUF1552 domain-containing protein [Planctomycetota bacterium]|nr:MAG: DUF1552 domain-containing protein [Planctomycetota bacterium]
MVTSRRMFLRTAGGTLALPLLEARGEPANGAPPPLRFLVVGNPFGAHPEFFFPKQFGRQFDMPTTLQPLQWLRDRMTIISHTDHNMVSGHGREIAFLSGVLPADAQAFPEKNMSLDQLLAQHVGTQTRFPSVGASLEAGIRMSWTASGVEKLPITDPQELFDHLFLNLTPEQKEARRRMLERNASLLDAAGDQFNRLRRQISTADQRRIDQFQTAVRELEQSLSDRNKWLDRDKPSYRPETRWDGPGATIYERYDAIFDMVAYAFQTDLTRVASIEFPAALNYTDIEPVDRSYHGCTHNGKREDLAAKLVAIERFQIERLSRCLQKLDAIAEPGTDGSLLDHTIVLYGSGMGYGGTHSNRNLPILVAGGGFKHRGHVDARDASGNNMPLCNLFVTILQRFGIERDKFNTSTGTFDFG